MVNFQLRLDAESVEHAFPSDPLAVDPQTSVREVFLLLKDSQAGHVIVGQPGEIQGIFTERDALIKVTDNPDTWCRPISAMMTACPQTLTAQQPISKALQMMIAGH